MMPDNKAEMVDNQISVWSKRIGLVLLGWFASSAYHGTLSLNQKAETLQHVQAVDIPKLKTAVHCESARADTTAKVAKTAIVSANSGTVPVPPPSAVPVDNCPHPAGK